MEEATKKALTQLNAGLDEVEITVLNEGKSGILGIGAEDARISVRLLKLEKEKEADSIEITKDILTKLLEGLGFKANIEVQSSNALPEEENESPIILNITGNDLGSLIGRRGQTLDSLQYLVRLIYTRQTKSKTPIVIDIENFKQRRYEDLRILALNVAEQVKSKKTSIRLEPMTPFERRIIHLTLANNADVSTESIGEGESRKVVVLPKKKF